VVAHPQPHKSSPVIHYSSSGIYNIASLEDPSITGCTACTITFEVQLLYLNTARMQLDLQKRLFSLKPLGLQKQCNYENKNIKRVTVERHKAKDGIFKSFKYCSLHLIFLLD